MTRHPRIPSQDPPQGHPKDPPPPLSLLSPDPKGHFNASNYPPLPGTQYPLKGSHMHFIFTTPFPSLLSLQLNIRKDKKDIFFSKDEKQIYFRLI
jgi:hypothetical protein